MGPLEPRGPGPELAAHIYVKKTVSNKVQIAQTYRSGTKEREREREWRERIP